MDAQEIVIFCNTDFCLFAKKMKGGEAVHTNEADAYNDRNVTAPKGNFLVWVHAQ